MQALIYEFLGTAILILLGNGVVANVGLNKAFGHSAGWIVIAMGWAMAVFSGVFVSAAESGAHLNPAVTIGLALAGKFEWSLLPGYWLAQLLGAMMGSLLVWLTYKKQYDITTDPGVLKSTFCTAPGIRSYGWNFMTEFIASFVLMIGVLHIIAPSSSLGALDALPVAFLVLAIGLSLGGATGYAINPARDLGPRIMHALLPLRHKGTNDWPYAWVPVIAPLAGAALAAVVFGWIQ